MTRVNVAHLALLAALPPYLMAALHAGWPASVTLAAGTLAAIGWLMVAERLWPRRADWAPSRADLQRDAAFFGVNALTDTFASLLLHGVAVLLAAGGLTSGFAAGWPVWLAFPLAVIAGEFGPYWLHRWAHRGGWAWRVHGVHHLPPRLHASNNITTHPFNVLWNRLARTLPWLALGFEPQILLAAALFLQVQSFATHANIAGTIGPLNRLIGSAELHRWHHSSVLAEARNFGTAIPLWDQVFGSYLLPPRSGPARLGIEDHAWPAAHDWRRLLWLPVCRRCAG